MYMSRKVRERTAQTAYGRMRDRQAEQKKEEVLPIWEENKRRRTPYKFLLQYNY